MFEAAVSLLFAAAACFLPNFCADARCFGVFTADDNFFAEFLREENYGLV
ncbi:MAG: hypothetical protein NC041_06535 [Bacteroides sp.]|nr:hypothetical protein [Prevotella sp.]MCM1406953.1 hypothetical protein [Treponema brennaborense]MCM1470104.1 hypothetical protein [Bacteroides sp.]